MKRAAILALLAGLGLLSILIARQGLQGIAAILAQGGWWLLLLIPIHALPLLPDALGWRALIIGETALFQLYWIAAVRQAVNRLLPVASIGGEFVGIRLLRRTGVPGHYAAASVVMEVVSTLVAEYLFVMLGIVCLLQITGVVRAIHALMIGMLVSLPVIIAIVLLVRHGSVFERVHRFALAAYGKISGEQNALADAELHNGARIDAAIGEIASSYLKLLRAVGWQFLNMLVSCLETWAALRLLGTSVSFIDALVLESLTSAARHILFMVPAGLGVQELSFIALGQLVGIGSEAAVAMSLAKRMSEVLFGLPALLSWQWAEARTFLRKSPAEH